MKNIISIVVLLHFTVLALSQTNADLEIRYEIQAIGERFVGQDQLMKARTLADINPGYPSSWIGSYASVDVSTTHDGKTMTVSSRDELLNTAQIELLKQAEVNAEVAVHVEYYPTISLTNKAKEIKFSYMVGPKKPANYPAGDEALKTYLKEQTNNKVSSVMQNKMTSAFIRFLIDETGRATDLEVTSSSGDDKIDRDLMDILKNMSAWNAAENTKGQKVKQAFEFRVGNMIGC